MLDPSNARMRTEAAILDTAVRVLARNPDASINEIAAAAGVGRATVHRYFPTRERLVRALGRSANHELASRIADAGLERVAVPVALERLLRAMLAVCDHYIFFLGDRTTRGPEDAEELARGIDQPIDALFQRGIADGTLRTDLEPELLRRLFGGLTVGAIDSGLLRREGLEHTAELITEIFLQGAGRTSA